MYMDNKQLFNSIQQKGILKKKVYFLNKCLCFGINEYSLELIEKKIYSVELMFIQWNEVYSRKKCLFRG